MFPDGDEKRNLTAGKVKIKENIDIFKCPVCGDRMRLDGFKSIICINRHCFDISRRGYVNLLLHPAKFQYDKKMFESRDIICRMGFFDPMIESICSLIDDKIHSFNSDYIRVLDAGCGEGFHVAEIMDNLHKNKGFDFQGVGIDISKEGIKIASKKYRDIIWCVANLSRIPFMNKKFHIILNILSPSNYGEFNRIIDRNGILIKVVPGSDYLKELRNVFYRETDRKTYSNDRVIKHFGENFNILSTQKILYNIAINKEQLKHLIIMTPLSWSASKERVQEAYNMGIDNITVDLTIILGKSKKG